MTIDDQAFGSNDLTPELVRGVTFDERDGRYDADEVRTFLDRVASSLEVFLADDARTALQTEFARNAEIAKQVLDAGQSAAEQLRRQAAEEAKRILDEARDATLGLRATVDDEIEQARTQVDAMRGAFIQDLRDLYDRIGASLYRFERAAEESSTAPIREPRKAGDEVRIEPAAVVEAPAPEPVSAPEPAPAPESVETEAPGEPELPEGAKPPAWQQLPAEAWTVGADEPVPPVPDAELEPEPASEFEPEPAAAPVTEPADDPFAVVEDEPLAPGEPLVDLRELSADASAADPEPLPADSGGSWLDGPAAAESAPESEVELAHDDALAEALIAGTEPIPAPVLATTPESPLAAPAQVEVSSDSLEIRQVILDLSAAGHPREQIATYLADQLHLRDPNAMIDATLGPPA